MLHVERLRLLRKKANLTQEEIANVIGTSRTNYVRYEKGYHQPPNDILNALANYFRVSTDYLLGRTEKSNEYILSAKDYPDVLQPFIQGNLLKMVLAITPRVGHETAENIKKLLEQETRDTIVSYDEANPSPVTDLLALLPYDMRKQPISLYDALDYIGKDEEIMRKLRESGYDDLGTLIIPTDGTPIASPPEKGQKKEASTELTPMEAAIVYFKAEKGRNPTDEELALFRAFTKPVLDSLPDKVD